MLLKGEIPQESQSTGINLRVGYSLLLPKMLFGK